MLFVQLKELNQRQMVPDKAKLIVPLNWSQEKCFCSWSQWAKDSGHLASVHTSSHLNYTVSSIPLPQPLPSMSPKHCNDITLTCFQIPSSVTVPTHKLLSCFPPSVGWRKSQCKSPRICIYLKWGDILKTYDTDFFLK